MKKLVIRGQSFGVVFCIVVAAAVVLMTGSAAWGVQTCDGDDDCDDGLFCNGTDVCKDGYCEPGWAVVCLIGYVCDEDNDVCQPTGACCVEITNGNSQTANAVAQADGITICRDDIIESECNRIQGKWNSTLTCDENTCDPEPGACILEDGSCKEVPRIECPADHWREGLCPSQVPTVTEWGMIVMSILLIGSAVWFIRRKQKV